MKRFQIRRRFFLKDFSPICLAGIALTAFFGIVSGLEIDPAEMEVVREIHAHILATEEKEASGERAVYSVEIPGSNHFYEMVPIKAGAFLMGSPETEEGRGNDEGPQREVTVSAFWMGKVPVTWDAFERFMYPERGNGGSGERVDGVSRPTPPYVDMTFGMGREGFPAISMTHHAANKFCQWLSAHTGHFYRLPTEAEWEYAARAGTQTRWSFGDDPELLDEYAWSVENSGYKSHRVGQKKPNPWGLHDMHGNVWEWTLDAYSSEGFSEMLGETTDPWAKPESEYPRVVKGGSWNDEQAELRSASRKGSDRDWKMMDPQLPQSVWYHTNALWLGFRIVRPATVPSPEEMYEYWNR